jgi:hypothetical protein
MLLDTKRDKYLKGIGEGHRLRSLPSLDFDERYGP